jgi:hypothetical protein
MQYHYGVGSNFITGVPPEFEYVLTLGLCMKPKFNNPKCMISKQGFTWSNIPDQIPNETSICMQMTKQQPFLEAQNFHHKLWILVEAITGCKISSDTSHSPDSLQYDPCAYHHIAAFNGVIEPQQDSLLHWHIMLYSSVLLPELLEKAAAASSMTLQTQIAKMLDSLTCTTIPHEIYQWYNDILASIQHAVNVLGVLI